MPAQAEPCWHCWTFLTHICCRRTPRQSNCLIFYRDLAFTSRALHNSGCKQPVRNYLFTYTSLCCVHSATSIRHLTGTAASPAPKVLVQMVRTGGTKAWSWLFPPTLFLQPVYTIFCDIASEYDAQTNSLWIPSVAMIIQEHYNQGHLCD